MKQSLGLKLSHGLTMTPQLQQAIRMLQLSSLELNLEIQGALDSNMMLELDEDDTAGFQDNATEPGTVELNGSDYAEAFEHDTTPDELPVDTAWEDIYDAATCYPRSGDTSEIYSDEYRDIVQRNLQHHLLSQLDLVTLSVTDKAIAIALIDAINDDGYLAVSLEEIRATLAADFDAEADEIEAVLHLVQTFEPAGIGARNLAESLSLQLAQLAHDTPWLDEARTVVGQHLELLAAHDYKRLAKQMKLEREQLEQAVALIQSLHPRPGSQVQDTRAEYVVPDVLVKKAGASWKVELNTDALPRLRINTGYAGMIRRADNSADNVSLKNHLQEARWFIKSLQSRSETLLRVASCIVEKQRAFLEFGEEAMKPLVLHDVAESLGLHDSTVSRVTTRKYMHTPRGVFELKYFFSSHVGTDEGGTRSATAIRAFIKKLIQAEKPEKPLSDNKIVELLAKQGIQVARRTVAKYREGMSIPSSSERKRRI
ncbi:MAG: RNA polymerase factor sigma-54 [Gammaproteobacteria bacterium]|nr:RNA polymerase factor sigma-54 [Gammaproteobacteria bacterium]